MISLATYDEANGLIFALNENLARPMLIVLCKKFELFFLTCFQRTDCNKPAPKFHL